MTFTASTLTSALAADLAALGFRDALLEHMPGTGVSHNHYRIIGSGWVLRAPHLSQSGMDAAAQLAIQSTAFERAAPSLATPKLRAVLPVSEALPRGGLIVEEIAGRLPNSTADLLAMARALAAIHSLPVPIPADRAPIPYHPRPLAPLAAGVKATLEAYLPSSGVSARAKSIVKKRLTWLVDTARHNQFEAINCLTISDAHPGNFRIQADGQAIFVDLEKPVYSCPTIDLAHAVIRVSSGWDPAAGLKFSAKDRAAFIETWLDAVPPEMATLAEPVITLVRQAVWLRTISFFMKWRTESAMQGPWSAARLGPSAAAHFRAHIDASLSEEGIISAAEDWS
jgi:aminoglycoside phosphotransferase (APT) family kinase protein